uniref:Mitochondrial inner membrane protease subunit 2 n=1 Tax=Eptatretus burgeri TaxID=7764 RepID=A0A8C4NCC0_EPTBU
QAESTSWCRSYLKAFAGGFLFAVPVTVTFLDRVAFVARVQGASMQPCLNPNGSQCPDVVLLNRWNVHSLDVKMPSIPFE